MFSFLLGRYLGVELLSCMVTPYLVHILAAWQAWVWVLGLPLRDCCRSVGKSLPHSLSLGNLISGLRNYPTCLSIISKVAVRCRPGCCQGKGFQEARPLCHPGECYCFAGYYSLSASFSHGSESHQSEEISYSCWFQQRDFLRIFSFVSFTVICFIAYRSNPCSLQKTKCRYNCF